MLQRRQAVKFRGRAATAPAAGDCCVLEMDAAVQGVDLRMNRVQESSW